MMQQQLELAEPLRSQVPLPSQVLTLVLSQRVA